MPSALAPVTQGGLALVALQQPIARARVPQLAGSIALPQARTVRGLFAPLVAFALATLRPLLHVTLATSVLSLGCQPAPVRGPAHQGGFLRLAWVSARPVLQATSARWLPLPTRRAAAAARRGLSAPQAVPVLLQSSALPVGTAATPWRA